LILEAVSAGKADQRAFVKGYTGSVSGTPSEQAIWGHNCCRFRSQKGNSGCDLQEKALLKALLKASLVDWRKNGVKIVHADELDMNTLQTSGMTRDADKEAKYGDRISEVLTSVKR
jgi:hypothetical protein